MDKGSQLFDAIILGDWLLVHQLIGPETANYCKNDRNWDSVTVLNWLIMTYRPKEIQMLIKANANVNTKRESDGKTPLHNACSGGVDANTIVKMLIQAGANVNALDKAGETPLIWAADYRMPQVIRTLLVMGADLFLRNKRGRTAKEFASRFDNGGENQTSKLLEQYEQQFIHCKTAQIAFCRIFQKHRRNQLVPDMVRMIADLIWKTRMLSEWIN